MGITPQMLTQAPPDQLLTETKDGQPDDANAQFDKAKASDVLPPKPGGTASAAFQPNQVTGITIDYHTSFSTHKLGTKANSKNVALVKACLRKHRKIVVKGRGRSRHLVCQKKPRRH